MRLRHRNLRFRLDVEVAKDEGDEEARRTYGAKKGCSEPLSLAAYAEISPQPAITRRAPVQAIEVGCACTSRMNCIRQIGHGASEKC